MPFEPSMEPVMEEPELKRAEKEVKEEHDALPFSRTPFGGADSDKGGYYKVNSQGEEVKIMKPPVMFRILAIWHNFMAPIVSMSFIVVCLSVLVFMGWLEYRNQEVYRAAFDLQDSECSFSKTNHNEMVIVSAICEVKK